MPINFLVKLSGSLLLTLVLAFNGCATSMLAEQAAHQAAPPPVENFAFDLSTPGADAGTLLVQTRQPSYQIVVEKYAIQVDAGKPLVVSKQSDVTIKLNAGKHSVKFYATSSNPADSEKVTFGISSTKDIATSGNLQLKLKYTGPYRLTGSGNIEELK